MMSLWDALRMNMMISYQELVRTFLKNDPEFLTFSTDKTTRREHVIGRLERARTILEGM